MTEDTQTLDGILDIALPLAPLDSGMGVYTIVAITLLIIGMLMGMAYLWWTRPRQLCRRQLVEALQQYENGHITAHQTAFRLAEILRQRLRCRQLSRHMQLPTHLHSYQVRWQSFIDELDAARYSAADIDQHALGRLSSETTFWIGRW